MYPSMNPAAAAAAAAAARHPVSPALPGPPQPGQPFKFTVAESCDRIKEEFGFLQAQYHNLKLECEKLASEKIEIQRHYVMYYEMSYGLNVEMHKQTEIAKRLNAIIAQVLPFLSQEHQQQVATAVERAKQVTMTELNAVLGQQRADLPRLLQQLHAGGMPHAGPPLPLGLGGPHPGLPGGPGMPPSSAAAASLLGIPGGLGGPQGPHPLSLLNAATMSAKPHESMREREREQREREEKPAVLPMDDRHRSSISPHDKFRGRSPEPEPKKPKKEEKDGHIFSFSSDEDEKELESDLDLTEHHMLSQHPVNSEILDITEKSVKVLQILAELPDLCHFESGEEIVVQRGRHYFEGRFTGEDMAFATAPEMKINIRTNSWLLAAFGRQLSEGTSISLEMNLRSLSVHGGHKFMRMCPGLKKELGNRRSAVSFNEPVPHARHHSCPLMWPEPDKKNKSDCLVLCDKCSGLARNARKRKRETAYVDEHQTLPVKVLLSEEMKLSHYPDLGPAVELVKTFQDVSTCILGRMYIIKRDYDWYHGKFPCDDPSFLSDVRVEIGIDDLSVKLFVGLKVVMANSLAEEKESSLEIISCLSYYGSFHRRCPGIKANNTQLTLPSMVLQSEPKPYFRHVDCKFFVPSGVSETQKALQLCGKCKDSKPRVKAIDKKHSSIVRTPPSKANVRFLTPRSLKKKISKYRSKVNTLSKKLSAIRRRVGLHDVELSSNQGDQLMNIMSIINRDHKDGLETVLSEDCPDPEIQKVLKEKWMADSARKAEADKKAFVADQKVNKNKNRGNRWSLISYRIALAVFLRSPSAYEALRNFQILQLPSVGTLRKIVQENKETAGDSNKNLSEECDSYEKVSKERSTLGLKPGLQEGVMVFDEVKVIDKVVWSSNTHEIAGVSESVESATLRDVYGHISGLGDETLPTKYVLQFLWRDLSTNHDVMGPHFTSSAAFVGWEVHVHLMRALLQFEKHNFKVRGLVCDGAATNMSLIKELCSSSKGYLGLSKDADAVKAWFPHPLRQDEKVACIICPSHQLKNMINALHSSGPRSARSFTKIREVASVEVPLDFGWKTIEWIFEGDLRRAAKGQPRRFPMLERAYVERDSWTKLNVYPAKVMQQEKLLANLKTEAEADAARTAHLLTYEYLHACHQLFEAGILSADKIFEPTSVPLMNMEKGMKWFSDWAREKHAFREEDTLCKKITDEKSFISWVTFDLLRIMYHGFVQLAHEFCADHPGYYIVPKRVNGSAVETIFSQVKHKTGGKLTGANYPSAKASLQLVREVHGNTSNARKDYRDVFLAFRERDPRQTKK